MLDSWLIGQDKNFNLLANDRTHLTVRTKPQPRQALHAWEAGSNLDLSINHKNRYIKDHPTTGAFTTTWEQYLRGDLPCLRHNPDFVANHPSRCCVFAEKESAWRKAIKAEELKKSGGDRNPQRPTRGNGKQPEYQRGSGRGSDQSKQDRRKNDQGQPDLKRQRAAMVNKLKQQEATADKIRADLARMDDDQSPSKRQRREHEGNLAMTLSSEGYSRTSAELDDILGCSDPQAFYARSNLLTNHELDEMLRDHAEGPSYNEGYPHTLINLRGSTQLDSDESDDEVRSSVDLSFSSKSTNSHSSRNYCELGNSYETDLADQTLTQLRLHDQSGANAFWVDAGIETLGKSDTTTNAESNAFIAGPSGEHRALKAYLDSGATDTMVPGANSQRLFSTYERVEGRNVTVADGNKATINGIGTLRLPISAAGKTLDVEDVLHVPDLQHSLISPHKVIKQLESRGAATAIVFTLNAAYLIDISSKPILDHIMGGHKMAVQSNSTYEMLQVTELLERCNDDEVSEVTSKPSLKRKIHANATIDDFTPVSKVRKACEQDGPRSGSDSYQGRRVRLSNSANAKTDSVYPTGITPADLIHTKYGHLNKEILMKTVSVAEKKLLSQHILSKCVSCPFGKLRAQPSRNSSHIALQMLQRIHTDTWPQPVKNYDGSKYAMVIIDEFTRYIRIIPLVSKGMAQESMITFIKNVEVEHSPLRVRCIRSDNGTELLSDYLRKNLMRKDGDNIEVVTAPGYEQKYNGLAETTVKVITTMGYIMLLHARLPAAFMVYAMLQAAHIKNIAYHTVSNMVPYKAWHRRAPNTDMLQTFGCLAIYHITPDLQELMKKDRRWLDFSNKLLGKPRGLPGIFLGNHGSTLYNIFCLLRKKVVHVSTAEFFPERFPGLKKDSYETIISDVLGQHSAPLLRHIEDLDPPGEEEIEYNDKNEAAAEFEGVPTISPDTLIRMRSNMDSQEGLILRGSDNTSLIGRKPVQMEETEESEIIYPETERTDVDQARESEMEVDTTPEVTESAEGRNETEVEAEPTQPEDTQTDISKNSESEGKPDDHTSDSDSEDGFGFEIVQPELDEELEEILAAKAQREEVLNALLDEEDVRKVLLTELFKERNPLISVKESSLNSLPVELRALMSHYGTDSGGEIYEMAARAFSASRDLRFQPELDDPSLPDKGYGHSAGNTEVHKIERISLLNAIKKKAIVDKLSGNLKEALLSLSKLTQGMKAEKVDATMIRETYQNLKGGPYLVSKLLGPEGYKEGTEVNATVSEGVKIHKSELPPVPQTHKQAMNSPLRMFWEAAIKTENDALIAREVYGISNLPKDRKALRCKYVFDYKTDADGFLLRFKCRLVACGYSQIPGQDFDQTHSPVVRIQTIRLVLALFMKYGFHLDNMDVSTAFLYADLKEANYMRAPPGMDLPEGKYLELKKALYGLHQSSREWYITLKTFLEKEGFKACTSDACLFVKDTHDISKVLIVMVYVDDIIILGKNRVIVDNLKDKFKKQYKMTDFGEAEHVLSIKVKRVKNGKKDGLYLGQGTYVQRMLEEAGYWNRDNILPSSTRSNPMSPTWKHDESAVLLSKEDTEKYRSYVMQAAWVATQTRPDIAYTVNTLAQYMQTPNSSDMSALVYLFRYMRGTYDWGLVLSCDNGPIELKGFADASFAEEQGRKSRSGYSVFIDDCIVSWFSKKQTIVALSSTEAEYVALSEIAKEILWMRELCREVGQELKDATTIMEDNKSAIAIANDPIHHGRVKHIQVKTHFFRDHLKKGHLKLEYIPTGDQIADLLTKPLPTAQHLKLARGMGLRSLNDLEGSSLVTFAALANV